MTSPNRHQDPTPNASVSFRKLVEHSVDGIIVVDTSGHIQFGNSAACELLHKPPEELVGYHFGYPAVSDAAVEIAIPHAGELLRVELRATEFEWHGRPALLINLRDVTAREQQTRRITQLNSALRAILAIDELILHEKDPRRLMNAACATLARHPNCHSASILVQDDDGGLRWIAGDPSTQVVHLPERPDCCVQAEHNPGRMVHQSGDDSCGGCPIADAHEQHDKFVTAIASDGHVFGFLLLMVTGDDALDPEESGLIQRLAANLGRGLSSIEAEAAQRHAQRELRDSEARFRALFEHSVDAIMITDRDGNYTHVNASACEMFGHSRETLLGMNVRDLTVPDGQPSVHEQYLRYVGNGKQAGTFSFIHPDGDQRWAEYSAFQLSPDRFVSVLRDMTDRRSLEEQFHQSQKMEAIGKLAGGIAHDFNNLLTAIISFTGFVRDEMPHGDPRRADISEALRAADRASSLTRQLLAFSRQQPITPEHVDLNALISDTDRLLRRTLGEDIEIVTLLQPELWPVFIDPGQFQQVVMNLTINARDAMPRGGKLVLETKNDHSGDVVRLRISDTGTGMDDQIKARIFDPFFTTKEKGKGTGLGLSMVYGLVIQAGGQIAVQSEPGRGTSFEISLPRATGAHAPKQKPSFRHADLAGDETILVIEDEPLVRMAVVRILSKHGYRVLEANNGTEAIALFETDGDEVDAVLCDVVMPYLSGPETAKALQAQRSDLKVLFMSGYADNTAMRHGLDPSKHVLNKPFSEEGLLTRIRTLLDRQTSAHT